jgi:hypothetical protein
MVILAVHRMPLKPPRAALGPLSVVNLTRRDSTRAGYAELVEKRAGRPAIGDATQDSGFVRDCAISAAAIFSRRATMAAILALGYCKVYAVNVATLGKLPVITDAEAG